MGITGSQVALTVARSGIARAGATRSGYSTANPDLHLAFITIGGVARRTATRRGSVEIRDHLNHAPNSCLLTVQGTAPTKGQEVIIRVGSTTSAPILFAGHVMAITQVAELNIPARRAWHLECTDYTWRFSARKVTTKFATGTPIATVASTLVSTFAPGFTTAGVAAGLGNLAEELTFIDTDLGQCFTELARRIGGYWKVDYLKDVSLFITSGLPAPTALTFAHPSLHSIEFSEDLSDVVTRVNGYGGGGSATLPRVVGSTRIPVDDATWYLSGGGKVLTGAQVLTYTGRHLGGVASTVPIVITITAAPGSAPFAALASTAGNVTPGSHSYKVSFVTAEGETLPSAASGGITAVDFLPPAGGIAVAATPSVVGPLIGAYNYKVTNVTAEGETTPGPATARTATAVAAPGAPTTAEVSNTIGKLLGAYSYKVTFLTPLGETLGGSVASRTVAAQPAPTAASVGTHTVAGPLIGSYSYKIGFVSAIGETIGTATGTTSPVATVASAPSVSGDGTGIEIAYAVTYVHPIFGESALSNRTVDTNKGTNPVVSVVSLPAGCGWNVYSTGSVAGGTGGTAPLYKVAEMGVGVASFTHTTQTGPAEGVRASMGKNIPLTSIDTGPSGTLARRIYRTKAGGSTYYLVSELADNSTTTFTDNVPDEGLTVSAPLENLNGRKIQLSAIPTGTSGIVVGRRVYRTKAGGATYHLLVELGDNSTSSYTDNLPDDALGVPIPLVATAGGQTHDLTGIAAGPTGTIARRIYRTTAGGTSYRLVSQLNDNTTTTYTDATADTELGAYAPAINTAGSSQVNLSSIPTGGAGVVRRNLYRTKAGGGEWFYVASINDNVTTTFTDNLADESLGVLAPIAASATAIGGGVVAGATSIPLVSTAGFPTSGWVEADSQRISYTGVAGGSLTGVPASGVGAIVGAIAGGTTVITMPMLTGVTGVIHEIKEGDTLTIFQEVNDTAAQTALAALLGGGFSGIRSESISDSALTHPEIQARAEALLEARKDARAEVRYTCRDFLSVSGATITVALTSPTFISGTFMIQDVTISEFQTSGDGHLPPLFTVVATTESFSLEDLLRQRKAA